MNTTITLRRTLTLSLVAIALFGGIFPMTGCGGGGGGSSSSSGVNKDNAEAPATLPAGLVANVDNGTLTFVDTSNWRNNVTADGTVTTGTYSYTASGNTGTLTVHYVDGNTQISELRNFTVRNGKYISALFVPTIPANVAPYTWTFTGTPMTYVAPATPLPGAVLNVGDSYESLYIVKSVTDTAITFYDPASNGTDPGTVFVKQSENLYLYEETYGINTPIGEYDKYYITAIASDKSSITIRNDWAYDDNGNGIIDAAEKLSSTNIYNRLSTAK